MGYFMLRNPHRRAYDRNVLIPLRLLMFSNARSKILDYPKTSTVLLGALPTQKQAQSLTKKYAAQGKKIYFITALADRETKTWLLGKLRPITSHSPDLHIISIPIHDHSMLDSDTNKILSLDKILTIFETIPNNNKTVVAFNCKAGKARSVVLTAIWLMAKNDFPLLKAMQLINAARKVSQTIPPGSKHNLLNSQAQGYLGYAFICLLSEGIRLNKTRKGSLYQNFISPMAKMGTTAKNKYLRNNLRPLLSMPIKDMDSTEQEQLITAFNDVRNYLIQNNYGDILAILSDAKERPLTNNEQTTLMSLVDSAG